MCCTVENFICRGLQTMATGSVSNLSIIINNNQVPRPRFLAVVVCGVSVDYLT